MNSFDFWMPTKVIFGVGTPDHTGEEVKGFGGNKVLLLYGGGSAVKSGLLERVTNSLSSAGLEWVAVGGIKPNPSAEYAQKIIDENQDKGFDFVLAVGGGSTIDTAKAVSYCLATPGVPVWDIFSGKFVPKKNLHVGVVLTIAAAGSETSNSAVLTNETLKIKRGISSQMNRPKFAIMDPSVTTSLPPRQTACGIVDILMHTLDRYFAEDTGNDVTDGIAAAVMKTVIKYGSIAMNDPQDMKARSEIMWAGSVSHNGMTGLGQTRDFSVHQLGQALSALYDTLHGESLSAVWASWARFVMNADIPRFAKYAREIWNIIEEDDVKAAEMGINTTEDYFRSISMPVSLKEVLGELSDETLKTIARKCSFNGSRKVGSLYPIGEEEMYQIYKMAY